MRSITDHLTKREVRKLREKWRGKEGTIRPYVTLASGPFADYVNRLFSEAKQREPNPEKVVCSFCGDEVDRVRATHGTGRLNRGVIREVVKDPLTGVKRIQEKVFHSTTKVVACPECVLNIKPRVDKHGDIQSQGITFPEGD
jgi:hypothetical protein